MTVTEELGKLRVEASFLRKKFADTWNAWQKQKQKNNNLEEQLKQSEAEKKALADQVRRLKDANQDLEDKLSALTEVKDKYQGMIFKAAVKSNLGSLTGKKRGGQTGHKGKSRKKPMEIGLEKDVYLTHCPDCDNALGQIKLLWADRILLWV